MASCVQRFFTILFVLSVFEVTHSANILGFFACPSRSHHIIYAAYMRGLAAKDHNLTILTDFPSNNPKELPPNYHEIPLNLDISTQDHMDETMKRFLKAQEENRDATFQNMSKFIRSIGRRMHESLQSNATQQLMKSGQKFDLVVLGWFMNDFLIGLAGHFRCPTVLITATPSIQPLRNLVANPTGAPITPFMGRGSNEVPAFGQRTINVIMSLVGNVLAGALDYFINEPYYELNFPAALNYPSFKEVRRNVSLVLVSDHFSEGVVRANMPNIREISGIQTKSEPNPLSAGLKKFLDEAEHGAILFSMGTNVKSSALTAAKLKTFFDVFGKLKQRIIWKWDGATIPPEKTENILMTKWLPQIDVLAHPNVRLFISHCGLGGTTEAKFHGVPILAIPIFADQPRNAESIVKEGWALHVPYSDITTESLLYGIQELLTNEKYAKRAKDISLLIRDRPLSALDEAVFWTEYVLRHNGARHMQSPAVHLNFIQQNSLDVLAALMLGAYVAIKSLKWLLVAVLSCCLRVVNGQKSNVKVKKN